jgi:multiple sugar transport system substrate-binding protein
MTLRKTITTAVPTAAPTNNDHDHDHKGSRQASTSSSRRKQRKAHGFVRQHLLTATAGVGAAALLLAACGSSTPSATQSPSGSSASTTAKSCPGGVTTVNEEDYYGAPSSTNATGTDFAKWFKTFNNTHPCVKVIHHGVTVTGDAQYLTQVLSQFSSGSQPNLLMLDNPQLDEFAAKGLLLPLKSLGSLPIVKTLNPANVAETTYDGKLYALPLYTNTIAIFYNKTLLKQAGITALPTTWAQFATDAKKTAHGTDLGFVFAGEAGPGNATWQFDPWAWSNGGSLSDPAGTPSIQALSFLTSLVKAGASPKNVVNLTQTTEIQSFEAGKAAFAENGLWNIPTLVKTFPKLKWGVFEIPTRVAGQTVIAPFGGEVWSIPKTTPAKEKAAFQVLKAMTSNVVSFSRAVNGVPTIPSAWKEAPWNTTAYAPFIAELKHGRARTSGLENPANEPAISLDIGNNIEAALVGKLSAAKAMQTAQTEIAPLLK